nr:MAG TPA: hypothetical protein [Caudoviricetes sp.]
MRGGFRIKAEKKRKHLYCNKKLLRFKAPIKTGACVIM